MIVFAGLFVVACTSGTSSLTDPSSSEKCGISASASLASVPANGGEGAITIHGARDCAWTLSIDSAWISTDGEIQGQGAGTVPYRVAPNGTPVARRAIVSIGSVRLDIAQEGTPCRFDIDRSQVDVQADGGTTTVRTTAMNGCTWTAQSQDAWIAITAGTMGNGTGEIVLAAARNAGAARQGTVNAAGHMVVVWQQGVGSTPPTPPAPPTPPPPPSPPTTPTPPSPPAPTPPAPSPPAPPSPPPSPVGRIDLEGRLSNLRGSCPAITFVLEGYAVYTDQSTEFRKGSCSHVAERGAVEVTGQRYSDGRVRGERITIEERRDD